MNKYEGHNWENGDIITATELDKISESLKQVSDYLYDSLLPDVFSSNKDYKKGDYIRVENNPNNQPDKICQFKNDHAAGELAASEVTEKPKITTILENIRDSINNLNNNIASLEENTGANDWRPLNVDLMRGTWQQGHSSSTSGSSNNRYTFTAPYNFGPHDAQIQLRVKNSSFRCYLWMWLVDSLAGTTGTPATAEYYEFSTEAYEIKIPQGKEFVINFEKGNNSAIISQDQVESMFEIQCHVGPLLEKSSNEQIADLKAHLTELFHLDYNYNKSIANSVSYDNILEAGTYTGNLNSPSLPTQQSHTLIVNVINNDKVVQTIIDVTGKIYTRGKDGNKGWSEWIDLLSKIETNTSNIEANISNLKSAVTQETNNLFWFTETQSGTKAGLTYEYIDRSTIKINGTAESHAYFSIRGATSASEKTTPAGTYIYKIELVSGTGTISKLRYNNGSTLINMNEAFTLSESAGIQFTIRSGQTCTNAVFRITMNAGTVLQPYIEGGLTAVDKIARQEFSNITNLNTRMTTAESDINALEAATGAMVYPDLSALSATEKQIVDPTDYNTLMTPGTYLIKDNTTAAKMINCPTVLGHRLIIGYVTGNTGTPHILQIVIDRNGTGKSTIYRRMYSPSNQAFGNWVSNDIRIDTLETSVSTLETNTAELSEKLSNVDAIANLPLIVNGIPSDMVVKVYSIGAYGIVPKKRCMYSIGEYEGNGTVTKIQIFCRDSSNVTRLFIDNLLPGNKGMFFVPEGTTAFRITGTIENETDTSDGKKLPIVFTQPVNSADVDLLYKASIIPDNIIWKDGYTNDRGTILSGDEDNKPVYAIIYDVEHLDFALSFSESHDLRLIVGAYGNDGIQIQRDMLIGTTSTGRNASYDAPANAAYVIVWYRTFNESNVLTMTGTLRTSNISKRSLAIEDVTPKAFNTTWERKTYTNSQIQDWNNTRAMSAVLSLRFGDTYTSINGILMRLIFCLNGVATGASEWANSFIISDTTLANRNGVRVLCKFGSAGSEEFPIELCERSVFHTGSNEELVPVEKYDPTVPVLGTTVVITAEQGKRYMCGTLTSLSFTPCNKGLCEVTFTCGSTPTVLLLPSTVKMPDWWTGVQADRTYDIMIMDGTYGVVRSWAI